MTRQEIERGERRGYFGQGRRSKALRKESAKSSSRGGRRRQKLVVAGRAAGQGSWAGQGPPSEVSSQKDSEREEWAEESEEESVSQSANIRHALNARTRGREEGTTHARRNPKLRRLPRDRPTDYASLSTSLLGRLQHSVFANEQESE